MLDRSKSPFKGGILIFDMFKLCFVNFMLSNSVSNISNSSHNMEFVRIMLFKK